MYIIRYRNSKNIFEYLNKRTQTAVNEYNFTIYNKKDLHNIR